MLCGIAFVITDDVESDIKDAFDLMYALMSIFIRLKTKFRK